MDGAPGYAPSRWALSLHGLPRVNLRLEPVASRFSPGDWEYQQALLLLGGVAILCLTLNLLLLLMYFARLCCSASGQVEEAKRPERSCPSWSSVAAVLICCAGIGIGFHGNSEIHDGMSQTTYSLVIVNRTLATMEKLVSNATGILDRAVREELTRLEEVFTERPEFLIITRNCRRQAEALLLHIRSLAFWKGFRFSLLDMAELGSYTEDYRWLAYILLLLLHLLICLLVLLGLVKHGKLLLMGVIVLAMLGLVLSWVSLGVESVAVLAVSDFCIDPATFILNLTEPELGVSADLLDYYLTCDDGAAHPLYQTLTLSQRAASLIHVQLQELQTAATGEFPTAQASLLSAQQTLQTTEGIFQHLLALLHCQASNQRYLEVLRGLCYTGVEGLLYLCLFSFLTAVALSSIVCRLAQIWRKTGRPRAPALEGLDDEDLFSAQGIGQPFRYLARAPLPTFHGRGCKPRPTAPPDCSAHYM